MAGKGHQHDLLLLAGIAVLPAAVISYAAATALEPEQDFIGQTLSKLVVPGRPEGTALGIGIVIVGLLVVAFAHGVRRALGDDAWTRLAHCTFTISGLLLIAGAFFPDDPVESIQRSAPGWAHDVIYYAALGAAVAGALGLSVSSWHRNRRCITHAGIGGAAILVIAEAALRGGTGFADGLLERIAVFVFLSWASFAAWRLNHAGSRFVPRRDTRRPSVFAGR